MTAAAEETTEGTHCNFVSSSTVQQQRCTERSKVKEREGVKEEEVEEKEEHIPANLWLEGVLGAGSQPIMSESSHGESFFVLFLKL